MDRQSWIADLSCTTMGPPPSWSCAFCSTPMRSMMAAVLIGQWSSRKSIASRKHKHERCPGSLQPKQEASSITTWDSRQKLTFWHKQKHGSLATCMFHKNLTCITDGRVLIIDTALLLTHKANKKLTALSCTVFENHGRPYMQYTIIPKNASKQKKHRKSTEPESCQTAKIFCFLSSSCSSSDGLIQNRVTLWWWFSHKTAAFYTEQCTSPSLFHNFEVSTVYVAVYSHCSLLTLLSLSLSLSLFDYLHCIHVATYSHCSLLTLTVSILFPPHPVPILYSCYIWTKSDFNRHL